MTEATLIPKFVNPAKPTKKWGSIVLADDTKYLIPAGTEGSFAVGMATTVDWMVAQWKDGPVNTIEKIIQPAAQPAAQPVAPSTAGPAPVAPSAAPSASSSGDAKSEEMFVMGVVGRAMGSGQFGVTDINALAKAATIAWRGRSIVYDPATDPDNEMPF